MKVMKYIVLRIKDYVKVIFEEEFIDHNEFKTQNEMIEVLSLIYDRKDFSVELYIKQIRKNKLRSELL